MLFAAHMLSAPNNQESLREKVVLIMRAFTNFAASSELVFSTSV